MNWGGFRARAWFDDPKTFQQLCLDARSQASGERAEEFTHEMLLRANEDGLDARLTEPQLKWLCQIADWVMPARRNAP